MSGQDVIPAAAALVPSGVAGQDLVGQDFADLERAVALLTTPSLTVRIAALVGTPVEKLLAKLPKGASRRIHGAVEAALEKSAQVALWKMDDAPERKASTRMHKAVAAATGAAGGFFGWTGLLVEIPASTTVMLRAIADIARSEGFSLADPRVQQDCIAVFSLGGTGAADDAAETGYYATRAMIEAATEGAAPALIAHAAKRSVAASEAGALLTKVVKAVAARLGVVFTEKAAAQMVPIIGAAGGATINALFTDHFQNMARGHFIVRRLEARHGAAAIEAEFRRLARARRSPPLPAPPTPPART